MVDPREEHIYMHSVKDGADIGQVSRAGDQPPNVAKKMANLWLDYKFAQLPITVGVRAYG